MEARNRKIEDWYGKIHRGEIKLPRFQRYEAWDWKRISSLLNTITQNLPLGITLVLEVGEKEQFISRYLVSAPTTNSRVLEQLWMDSKGLLPCGVSFIIITNLKPSMFIFLNSIYMGKKRAMNNSSFCRDEYYQKNGQRYPLWCDNPEDCLRRGMIPTELLRPEDIQPDIDTWITKATNYRKPANPEELEGFFNWKKSVSDKINELRSIIKNYNLPYLSLPTSTAKDIALEVFINMNTNSKHCQTMIS
jgi:hypothetical protein